MKTKQNKDEYDEGEPEKRWTKKQIQWLCLMLFWQNEEKLSKQVWRFSLKIPVKFTLMDIATAILSTELFSNSRV